MARTEMTLRYENQVSALADGTRSSIEIATLTGLNPRHVRKILLRLDLPRLPNHSPTGSRNAAFSGGRRIGLGGYVHVSCPVDHPYGRLLSGKNIPRIFEHRLVMEAHLGRYLLPTEIVDHVDGLTLHNAPCNLRVFSNNAEHLRETLLGKVPKWSDEGFQNMLLRHTQDVSLQLVDTYGQRKKSGDVRLRQILLLALTLGIDSPFLLGTTQWSKKAGIDMSSRSTIELALADLHRRWGWLQTP